MLNRLMAGIRASGVDSFGSAELPPRMLRLCRSYEFSEREVDLFQLIVVVQGSQSSHVLNALIDEDYLRRITGFQRMSDVADSRLPPRADSRR